MSVLFSSKYLMASTEDKKDNYHEIKPLIYKSKGFFYE